MNRKRLRLLWIAPVALIFLALFGYLLMTLWNWLMPAIFGLGTITYWQAWGVLILSKLIFGGFHGSGRGGNWRHRMMERCERMTPEEREKFRQAFESRWGRMSPPPPEPNA